MKKILSILMLLAMLVCLGSASAFADEAEEADFLTVISGESGIIYINLFEEILQEKYDDLWLKYCGDNAEQVAMLKEYISGNLYGEDAFKVYGDGSNGFIFDCFYINDVNSITVNGNQITIEKNDGSAETHTYSYVGKRLVGDGETMYYNGDAFSAAFECDVYRSNDEASEFNYFFFRDDTMETTYHLELRYGTDLDNLSKYMMGKYAYWLAAGFDADADAETTENVIALFCGEK